MGTQIRSRLPPLSSIDGPSPLAHINENTTQTKSLIPLDTSIQSSSYQKPSIVTKYSSFISFFSSLWNSPTSVPDPTVYLQGLSTTVNNELLQSLPSSPLITQAEIKIAIASLNKNSSPGLDGLTANFYSSFPSLIPLLCQTYNNSYLRNQLSKSQRLALIKLIPKKPNPSTVKDWRPISLLNTDYKILSTIISNRLKPILNYIISFEQQCGLPKRQIFNNHLNIKSAIDFAENFHQPLAIVQIDFYKAFDSIFHQFLLQTASQLGIPSSLLKWIRIFLSNLTSKINLNGYLSNSIPVKRGIRQGCPLSMLLFIIAIEPLTRKILASANFKGISLGKTTLKVSHFADDLTLFITHPSSFSTLLEILNQFSLFSGLKINHDKTTIISNSPDLISSFQSNFPRGKILQSTKILGIFFSFKTDLLMQNWDALVRSIPRTTLTLLNPNDSLFSKVISINQHFLPKILFLSRIIPPTPKHIKTLNSFLFKFLWNFSPFEPIKRSTLYLPKADGGIALPSIGLKISTAFLWQLIVLLQTPKPLHHFWMHFAIYNLGTKLIPFNPDLYSNTQPHRPKPNPHWKKALNLLHKTSIPSDHLPKLTFKSLYLLLLKPDPIPLPREIDIPQTNGNNQANPYTWLRLTLFKPRPSLFSNFEKEITFRTAYKGYAWGCFFQKHNFTPKTPMIFSVNYVFLPSMILTIYSLTALLLNI